VKRKPLRERWREAKANPRPLSETGPATWRSIKAIVAGELMHLAMRIDFDVVLSIAFVALRKAYGPAFDADAKILGELVRETTERRRGPTH